MALHATLVGDTDTTVIQAAVTNRRVRLLAAFITNSVVTVAESCRFESTGGGDLSGDLDFINGPVTLPYSSEGWAITALGEGLQIEETGGGNLDGIVVYDIIAG